MQSLFRTGSPIIAGAGICRTMIYSDWLGDRPTVTDVGTKPLLVSVTSANVVGPNFRVVLVVANALIGLRMDHAREIHLSVQKFSVRGKTRLNKRAYLCNRCQLQQEDQYRLA